MTNMINDQESFQDSANQEPFENKCEYIVILSDL